MYHLSIRSVIHAEYSDCTRTGGRRGGYSRYGDTYLQPTAGMGTPIFNWPAVSVEDRGKVHSAKSCFVRGSNTSVALTSVALRTGTGTQPFTEGPSSSPFWAFCSHRPGFRCSDGGHQARWDGFPVNSGLHRWQAPNVASGNSPVAIDRPLGGRQWQEY